MEKALILPQMESQMVQRTIMNGLDMAFADIPLPYGVIITFKLSTFNGDWYPSLSRLL